MMNEKLSKVMNAVIGNPVKEESKKLKDVIARFHEARAGAGFIYDYDDEGNIVRTDGIPLSRKERRMFAQAEKRRQKKLKNIRFQARWEQEKIDRANQANKGNEVEGSYGQSDGASV